MTRIDVGGESSDESDGGLDGLLALVVAVVEILVDALEREAVRRMDSGDLSEAEIERLGSQLASLEAELDRLKAEMEVEEPVDDLRGQLDGLVGDALSRVRADEFEGGTPGSWLDSAQPDAPDSSSSEGATR